MDEIGGMTVEVGNRKVSFNQKDEEMADLSLLADQGFGGIAEKSAPPIKKSMKILN